MYLSKYMCTYHWYNWFPVQCLVAEDHTPVNTQTKFDQNLGTSPSLFGTYNFIQSFPEWIQLPDRGIVASSKHPTLIFDLWGRVIGKVDNFGKPGVQQYYRNILDNGGTACFTLVRIIGIFNGCEVWIENSVTRVTVQHHEACPTVIPSDGIFNSHRTAIIYSFSCILFLWRLY